jgi:hypothetical protein
MSVCHYTYENEAGDQVITAKHRISYFFLILLSMFLYLLALQTGYWSISGNHSVFSAVVGTLAPLGTILLLRFVERVLIATPTSRGEKLNFGVLVHWCTTLALFSTMRFLPELSSFEDWFLSKLDNPRLAYLAVCTSISFLAALPQLFWRSLFDNRRVKLVYLITVVGIHSFALMALLD